MRNGRSRVIAIDGPAGSGKSSTARAVAERLGMVHLDSGSLYRLATLIANEAGSRSPEEIVRLAEEAGVILGRQGGGATLVPVRDGIAVGDEIRTRAVTDAVSEVSAMPPVRAWVNRLLREAVSRGSAAGVMDGRDIGTVVFPDAALKVFMVAPPEVRAVRRLRQEGRPADAYLVLNESARLAERDRLDSSRPVAPLARAADARVLDSGAMTFEEQVATIIGWAREAGLP